MSDAVLFDAREDGIAVITLNRPEARNALGGTAHPYDPAADHDGDCSDWKADQRATRL